MHVLTCFVYMHLEWFTFHYLTFSRLCVNNCACLCTVVMLYFENNEANSTTICKVKPNIILQKYLGVSFLSWPFSESVFYVEAAFLTWCCCCVSE